jgi:hypothetical protein
MYERDEIDFGQSAEDDDQLDMETKRAWILRYLLVKLDDLENDRDPQ